MESYLQSKNTILAKEENDVTCETLSLSAMIIGPRRSSASQRNPPVPTSISMDGSDAFLQRASSYRQKCSAANSRVLGRAKNEDDLDAFSSSSPKFSRWNRSDGPIVIHEDEDESEDDSFIVESFSHLKPFLHSPSVDRRVLGLGGSNSSFVIQHIGVLHAQPTTQVFTN